MGAIQPAHGWLSESIIYGSTGEHPAVELTDSELLSCIDSELLESELAGSAAAAGALPFAGPLSAPPGAGQPSRRGRRRVSRPVASVCISSGLVVASAAAVFVLTGAVPRPPIPQAQSQADGSQTTPASASHVSVTPRPLSSARPAVPSPNAYLTPALSEFLTTSPPAAVWPAKSPAAAKSPAPAKSRRPVIVPVHLAVPVAVAVCLLNERVAVTVTISF